MGGPAMSAPERTDWGLRAWRRRPLAPPRSPFGSIRVFWQISRIWGMGGDVGMEQPSNLLSSRQPCPVENARGTGSLGYHPGECCAVARGRHLSQRAVHVVWGSRTTEKVNNSGLLNGCRISTPQDRTRVSRARPFFLPVSVGRIVPGAERSEEAYFSTLQPLVPWGRVNLLCC